MNIIAFHPTGKTIKVVAAVAAPTGVVAPETGASISHQYRIHNAGTVLAFLSVGASAATAQSNAVVPTGTSQNSIPLPPGIVEVLSFNDGVFFSAITESSTANIFITPGKGL